MQKSKFYKEIKKKIFHPRSHELTDLSCSICNAKTKDLFHFTKPKYLNSIVKDGWLKLAKDEVSKGGAVSFTKDPNFLFPNGNVKLVFHSSSVGTKPMCYYDWNKMSSKEKELVDTIESQASIKHKGFNEIRSDYGIQDVSYEDECEWFTKEDVSLKKNLKEIVLYVPWIIGKDDSINCQRTHPKYSHNAHDSFDQFTKDVSHVRSIANQLGVPFRVDSSFPYIEKSYYNNEYIPLTHLNLQRITNGEEPIIMNKPPKVDANNECQLSMTDDDLFSYNIERRK